MRRTIAMACGFLWLLATPWSGASAPALASSEFETGRIHPDAPVETLALGRLAGVWDARQEVRSQDGTWKPTGTAEWRFYYIMNGHAIQDDWIKPPPGVGPDDERSFGTNLRIYDAEAGQWVMTWLDTTNRRVASFTAKNVGDRVVMEGTNAAGRAIRNVFFDITESSFEWVQQWSFDDGATWVDVARIHATRRS